MNFKIFIIGDKLEKFFIEAIKEYEKRLSRYCKIQLINVKNEAELLKKLPDKSYKIQLIISGENISSEALAEKLNNFAVNSTPDIAIVIGESNFSCDEQLSLCSMEMSLGLQATVIFEQIYRAYRIINKEPYHK
jgi:23S rRNA (pseudouridine1915-N3)-methyltransferase